MESVLLETYLLSQQQQQQQEFLANVTDMNDTQQFPPPPSPETVFLLNMATLVCFLLAMVTNVIVVMMTRKVETQGSSVTFIRNLAVNELLICLEGLLLGAEDLSDGHILGYRRFVVVCKFLKFSNWVLNYNNIILYAAITVDRAIAVSKPFLYRNKCNQRFATNLTAVFLTIGVVVASPLLIYQSIHRSHCVALPNQPFLREWSRISRLLFRLALPVAIIVISSLVILYNIVVRKRLKERASHDDYRVTVIVVGMAVCTSVMICSSSLWVHFMLEGNAGQAFLFAHVSKMAKALNSSVNLLFYWMAPSFRKAILATVQPLLPRQTTLGRSGSGDRSDMTAVTSPSGGGGGLAVPTDGGCRERSGTMCQYV